MGTKLVKSQSGTLLFQDTLLEYESTLARLRSIGIRVNEHGRLESYRKTLAAMVGASDVGLMVISGALQAEVSVALAEATEIIDIGRGFRGKPSAAFMERFRILGKGEISGDDDLHAKGRDAQFELWLAALLRSNGAKVTAGTPDLAVKTPYGRLHLEAKRLTSAARFDDRLHEAVGAIGRTDEDGAVIVSIDQVVRPKHHAAMASSFAVLEREVGAVLHNFSERHASVIAQRTASSRVVAIILSLKMPAAVGAARQHTVYHGIHIHPTSRRIATGTKALDWVVRTLRRTNLPD